MKCLTVGVVALAFAAQVFAQGDDKPIRVRGVVKEVKADTTTLTITLNKKEGADAAATASFVVKDDVAIKSGTDDIKLTDLKVGDKVRIDYKEADGKKVASRIRVENDEK